MPTSYTTSLGLALPVTGELSGTWGDVVNDYITTYLDGSVAGTQTISGTQTAVTLSKTTGSALAQVGSGATGSSQYSIINCTGNPAGTLTITVPAVSKPYIVINATSTSQSVKIVGAGPTTGVTLVAGEKAVVAWDGSDFTKIATSAADGVTSVSGTGTVQGLTLSGTVTSTGSLTLGGSLSAVSLTSQVSGTLPVANGGTGVTTSTGSGSVVLSTSPALTTPNLGTPSAATLTNATGLPLSTGVTGTLPVANGGTGQTTYTDGQLLIGNSSGNTLTKATLTAGSGVSITNGNGSISIAATGSGGTVTSVSFTGGIISVANGTTTPAFTVAGTSGGIPYFTGASTWATSAALAANALVLGGGAGAAPATTTTGTGVVTAVGNAVNTTGGLVTQSGTLSSSALLLGGGSGSAITSTTTGTGVVTAVGNAVNTTGGLVTQSGTLASNNVLLGGGSGTAISSSNLLSVAAAVTSGNYIRAIGYADTVTALGNTGTAINIDVTSGGVFTATLTGNCTFTLRYPVATGSSSFTLILTNDGTAGRTVAWSGGAFRFPGGAASLSRTTTANAVDVWVFFTPDGGTTWYGSIPMKNMTA